MKDKDGREHDDKGQFDKANEFRYTNKKKDDPSSGHPNHIYAKNDTHAKHMTITHAKNVNGKDTIPMRKNPNLVDKSTAYFVPMSRTSKLTDFDKKPKRFWELSEQDDKAMDKYRDK